MAVHTERFVGGLLVTYDDETHVLTFAGPFLSGTTTLTVNVGSANSPASIDFDHLAQAVRDRIDGNVPLAGISITGDGTIEFSDHRGTTVTYENPVNTERYVPPGGAVGDFLGKSNADDYQTEWRAPPAGSGNGGTPLSADGVLDLAETTRPKHTPVSYTHLTLPTTPDV